MCTLISICNPFDLNDSYNVPNVSRTQKQLEQHFGSSLYDKVSSIIATDINTYSCPAAQTMMDVYHHWSLHSKSHQTWTDFINNTSLSHLRSNNMNIFSPFQDYQHHFTSNIYAPLSQYNGNAFKGNANDLVMKLSDIYNHLKRRKTAPNCCMQVDVRLSPDKQTDSSVYPKSNISKYGNIDNVMIKCMDPLNTMPCSYKRYEMLLDQESDKVITFEAISNNTLPSCSVRNSPLCRIWNSTQSTPEIINYLNQNETESMSDLLTFSYHLLNDCIQIYMFIACGDKLYGSRIFREDLVTTIPSLFENKTIDKHTLKELESYLEFKDDKIYNEYKQVLFKHDLQNELEAFVYSWNNRNDRSRQIDFDQIMEIFINHNIDAAYFENTHRSKFVKLLQRNRIITCIANQLWLDFGGHLSDDLELEYDELSVPSEWETDDDIMTESTISSKRSSWFDEYDNGDDTANSYLSPSSSMVNDIDFEYPPWPEYDPYAQQQQGISFKCDEEKNKAFFIEHEHESILPEHDYQCLNGFVSNVYDDYNADNDDNDDDEKWVIEDRENSELKRMVNHNEEIESKQEDDNDDCFNVASDWEMDQDEDEDEDEAMQCKLYEYVEKQQLKYMQKLYVERIKLLEQQLVKNKEENEDLKDVIKNMIDTDDAMNDESQQEINYLYPLKVNHGYDIMIDEALFVLCSIHLYLYALYTMNGVNIANLYSLQMMKNFYQ